MELHKQIRRNDDGTHRHVLRIRHPILDDEQVHTFDEAVHARRVLCFVRGKTVASILVTSVDHAAKERRAAQPRKLFHASAPPTPRRRR